MPTGQINSNKFGFGALPNYGIKPAPATPVSTGGAGLDRQNIDSLLRGEFDPYEINMESAERSLGSGVGGSGFAQAGRYKLLDSEKLARQKLGHEELDPYLQREHQSAMQSSEQAARLKEIAAQGEQALQQLQASQSGRMAELSMQEQAALERQILSGKQAMEHLRLSESGANERNRTSVGGSLLGTILQTYGRGGSSGPTGTTRPVIGSFSGPESTNGFAGSLSGTGYMQPGYPDDNKPLPSYGGGISSNIVQNILRQYGLKGLGI